MKKFLFSLLTIGALMGSAKADMFFDTVLLKVSFFAPYQIPVPWLGYEEDASFGEESLFWGTYSVYGLDVALPWSKSKDVYGIGLGIYPDYETTAGVIASIVSKTDTLYGLQVGLINIANRAHGLQIGLVNIIKTSPLTWFPIINGHF